ncbi:PilZ domain-containing protein [Qipengyuania sp. MTN3-11]|uniref:PilZ domain-containing protein n=1 Tax=Qipengyuania sp. MTN3-11 TaxID=3056557 RepID=UPI0036F27A59
MDYTSIDRIPAEATGTSADQREAPRYISLIRAAKLISSQGEFVCVIRDVSALGIGLRLFHELPVGNHFALELQNGETFELEKVREHEREASFTFAKPVCVEELISENWTYPKRQLRLNIALPLTVSSLSGRAEAIAENLSQQGCRLDCDSAFAIDQIVRIQGDKVPEIRAKVRWRKGTSYGLVFESTFTLREFAHLAASLQCPQLLRV